MIKKLTFIAMISLFVILSGCTKVIVFNELINNPEKYKNKNICTNGVYAVGFEVDNLAESIYQKDDTIYLTKPTIWIERANIKSKSECIKNNFNTEFCKVNICGVFEYGGKYGHLGGFQYQIKARGS